jgi:hypothetical protein
MSGEAPAPGVRTIARVAATIGTRDYRVDLKTRHHALVAGEPKGLGGGDVGPAPYDYLRSCQTNVAAEVERC